MNGEVLKSYLVSLSADTDMASFAKFDGVLKTAEASVSKYVSKGIGDFLKFQVAATSVFSAIGFSVIGYIDHLAMADQKQRMLAMQNGMSIQSYRAMTSALDVMGVSLEDVFKGTAQMQEQFSALVQHQEKLNTMLGPNYEHQMDQVMQVVTQFQMLERDLQAFGMKFASDLLSKSGFGNDGLLAQLERFNTWVLEEMPKWSAELSTDVIPVLKDFWQITKLTGEVLWGMAGVFTNVMGVLEGDSSLESSTTNFHQFAKAVGYAADEVAILLRLMLAGEKVTLDLGAAIWSGTSDKTLTGHGDGAWRRYLKDAWDATSDKNLLSQDNTSTPTSDLKGFLDKHGAASAASPDLINRIIHAESGGNPNAVSPVGARGLMQIMPSTAAAMGGNINDPAQNVAMGTALINSLLMHYGGNTDYALAAYNMGEGKLDSYIRTGHYIDSRGRTASRIPTETMDYVRKITGHNLIVTVNVGSMQNTTPDKLAEIVKNRVKDVYQQHAEQLNGSYGG